MKRLLEFLLPVLLLIPVAVSALEVPVLSGRVNDYAGMISPETERVLEEQLRTFEETDSTQVVILTVNSLEGDLLEDFSIRVAENWKIGQAKKDNGVLFLVSKTDRRMRIEVGRGLEGVLTDLLSGRILDNIVKPKFKAGDYNGGFTEGTGAIIEACRGEFKNEGEAASSSEGLSENFFSIMFFILYFVIIITANFSRLLSGGIGAVSLPLLLHFGFSPLGLIEAVIAVVAGFVIALILPFIPILSFSGGGGSGGRGGGFSGGGGSFGGGGSSGGW